VNDAFPPDSEPGPDMTRPRDPDPEKPAAADPLDAFREREIPAGLLDDLYASVRERVPLVPAGGGLTLSFLNAPRVLRLWRTTAVAAVLLLAVSGGFLVAGLGGSARPAEVPLDEQDGIPWSANEVPRTSSGFVPIAWPPHRAGRSFYGVVVPKAPEKKPAPPDQPPERWN
jgi:hypothetical protein